MNLGALFRFAKSRIYNPFLLARQTSRLEGLIDSDPTGWLTEMVVPSLKGSGGSGRTVAEVWLRDSRGRTTVRGETAGGGRTKEDWVEAEERRVGGEGGRGGRGESGRGTERGEYIMSWLACTRMYETK